MRFSDLLHTALLNLWRRKLRAFLTVLGLVIGVASIVVMVSLGIGIRKATIEAYAGTGSLTTIQVSSWSYKVVNEETGAGESSEKEITDKALDAIRQIDGVKAVMPMVTVSGILKSGKYAAWTSILGVDRESAEEFGFTLSEGRFSEGKDGSSYELVLGAWTLQEFSNTKTGNAAYDRDGNPLVTMDSRLQLTFDYNQIYGDPMYQNETMAKGKFYRVSPVGQMSMDSNNYSWYCLMELSALKKLMKENEPFVGEYPKTYYEAVVKCEELEDVRAVKAAIDNMGFGTYSPIDAVDMAEENTQNIQLLLGAIGGVALLVAAIGIMNTMMMSIFERTKEIGIIKVLGCRMGNIAALFLAEAAFIGLFGGALGLAVSYGLSGLINVFLGSSTGFQSIIPLYLAVGAVAFSIVVALASGLYPALRAMRLSPLNAIRSE